MAGLLTFPCHKSNTTEPESDVMRPGGERAVRLRHKPSGVFAVRTVRPKLRSACAASPCVRGRGEALRAHERKKKLLLLGHVRWTDFYAERG